MVPIDSQWNSVEFDGWIHQSLIDLKGNNVSIKTIDDPTNQCNIRPEPKSDTKIGTIKNTELMGISFQQIGKDGNWFKIHIRGFIKQS